MKKDTQVLQIPADILNPEVSWKKSNALKILRKIVEQLNPNYRLLVKLRYFKEYTYDEIAQELKIPIGTVKAQLHRSREQLFKILSGSQEKNLMEQIQSYFPNLSSNQIKQFEQLPTLYDHWNAQINVVSRKDIDALLERHVLHSLGIAR